MPISFPSSPSNGQTYTVGARTWTWSGTFWELNANTIATASVGTGQIADNAITTAKIAAGAVVTADIADYAVTQLKMGASVSAITVCTSTTRPASPFTGQTIFETNLNRFGVWGGSFWLFDLALSQFYDFSGTIQFGTCGATGPLGPTLSNAISSYSAQPYSSSWLQNTDLFNCVAGVQYWRVPITGTYTIRVAGARSGPSTFGGLGIDITSTFSLNAGEWTKIVCGQRGEGNSAGYGGAGGASYIAVNRLGDWLPLLISGGGAGITVNSPQSTNTNRNAFNPSVRPAETNGGAGSQYDTSFNTNIGTSWPGGGGGGWGSDGVNGAINIYATNQNTGGRKISSESPIGGIYFLNQANTYNGGFGGGGASGFNGGGAGGGGGWWGGNATFSGTSQNSDDSTHLGGGSFSTNPTYTVNGTNNGEGFVYVTL